MHKERVINKTDWAINFWADIFLLIGTCSILVLFSCKEIDLTNSDLGRHITNGRLIFQSLFESYSDFLKIITTNLYSYTNSDFPFLNHHWGSGLIFYGIQEVFGFDGLSLFYLGLTLTTFLISIRLAMTYLEDRKVSRPSVTTLIIFSWLTFPLIASRQEIRPEGFSYLFIILFLWILTRWKEHQVSDRWLYLVPGLTIFWVNLHIYFFFGLLLVLFFLGDRIFNHDEPQRIKALLKIVGLTAVATLINPIGLELARFPLLIFRNYGYEVYENQSILFFFSDRPDVQPPFTFSYLILLGTLILSLVIRRSPRKKGEIPIAETAVALFFVVFSFKAVRNVSLFGFLAPPLYAKFLSQARISTFPKILRAQWLLLLAVCLSWSIYFTKRPMENFYEPKIGLASEVNNAGEFLKTYRISGPIFNNYDIGGYLIYHLFPSLKVFVDNRPEAYPDSFFRDIYVPMQSYDAIWQDQLKQWSFNTIVFLWHDMTAWGRTFLRARIKDPEWALVFLDRYSIIFLKRTPSNRSLIDSLEIKEKIPTLDLI